MDSKSDLPADPTSPSPPALNINQGASVQNGGAPDLARLRLSQDFGATINVKRALITVPVRKPNRQAYVRVRPGEEWRLQTAVIELKDDREVYVVDRPLWEELAGELAPKLFVTAIDRQKVLFLWPIRLPGADGRVDEWNRSALEAADMATHHWISVRSNMALGAYEVFQAASTLPEPEWPDVAFPKLVEIAFRDRFITSLDHPVLRRLRGET